MYSQDDVTGAFPHALELVLNIGSRWAGVSLEELADMVAKFERKLVWNLKRTRFQNRKHTKEGFASRTKGGNKSAKGKERSNAVRRKKFGTDAWSETEPEEEIDFGEADGDDSDFE
jgi:hypothetical protein